VLMAAALITKRRRPRLTTTAIVVALALLLAGGNRWAALQLARSLEWRNIPLAPLPRAEAIVVLGGATEPAFWPRPWVHLNEAGDRVLYAAKLYREGRAPLLIVSGGGWYGAPEAASMAEILKFVGVPDSAIVRETGSLNTHQNAVNVREILAARGIHRILLVTSAMHMPRAMAVFRHEGIDAVAVPTDFVATEREMEESYSGPAAILVNLLPDAESLAWTSRALKEYFGLAAYRLAGWL